MSNATAHPHLTPEFIAANRGGALIAMASVFIVVIVAFVSLRFYARHSTKTHWGLDDYLVLVSLFVCIGNSVIAICGVKYAGSGRHIAALSIYHPKLVTAFYKWLLAISSFYFFSVGFPKLAILAFYMRVFTAKSHRIIVYCIASIIIATGVVAPIMALNLCHPFAFNWDRKIPGGYCVDESAFYRWGSFPNIITDVGILIVPLPIVWKLQMSTNMKIGLTLTFLTGSIGLAFSIIRFYSFWKGNAFTDGTWDTPLVYWTMVEPDIYLVASCLPTYRPLLNQFLSKARQLRKTNITSPTGNTAGLSNSSYKLGRIGIDSENKKSNGFRKLGKDDCESTLNLSRSYNTGDLESLRGSRER